MFCLEYRGGKLSQLSSGSRASVAPWIHEAATMATPTRRIKPDYNAPRVFVCLLVSLPTSSDLIDGGSMEALAPVSEPASALALAQAARLRADCSAALSALNRQPAAAVAVDKLAELSLLPAHRFFLFFFEPPRSLVSLKHSAKSYRGKWANSSIRPGFYESVLLTKKCLACTGE